MKRFKGIVKRSLYTWDCPSCGYLVHDCYDDPGSCPSCGWSCW